MPFSSAARRIVRHRWRVVVGPERKRSEAGWSVTLDLSDKLSPCLFLDPVWVETEDFLLRFSFGGLWFNPRTDSKETNRNPVVIYCVCVISQWCVRSVYCNEEYSDSCVIDSLIKGKVNIKHKWPCIRDTCSNTPLRAMSDNVFARKFLFAAFLIN